MSIHKLVCYGAIIAIIIVVVFIYIGITLETGEILANYRNTYRTLSLSRTSNSVRESINTIMEEVDRDLSMAPTITGDANWGLPLDDWENVHLTSAFRVYGDNSSLKHGGIDIQHKHQPRIGRPILAIGDGIVEFSGWNGGAGNDILIDHGNGYKSRYSHLDIRAVVAGEEVTCGQTIGELGNTGQANSTGHLHFEIHRLVKNNWVKVNPGLVLGGERMPLIADFPTNWTSTYINRPWIEWQNASGFISYNDIQGFADITDEDVADAL